MHVKGVSLMNRRDKGSGFRIPESFPFLARFMEQDPGKNCFSQCCIFIKNRGWVCEVWEGGKGPHLL